MLSCFFIFCDIDVTLTICWRIDKIPTEKKEQRDILWNCCQHFFVVFIYLRFLAMPPTHPTTSNISRLSSQRYFELKYYFLIKSRICKKKCIFVSSFLPYAAVCLSRHTEKAWKKSEINNKASYNWNIPELYYEFQHTNCERETKIRC